MPVLTLWDTMAMVWNSIVSEYLYKSQLEAGVVIGEQDVWNAIIANPSIKGAPDFKMNWVLLMKTNWKNIWLT